MTNYSYTSIQNVRHTISVLKECAKSCRSLSNFFSRNLLFCDDEKFVQLVNNCAATCDLALLLIERKSPIVADFLEVCEELALECAKACSDHSYDLSCQCVKACEKVANACLPFILSKEQETSYASA